MHSAPAEVRVPFTPGTQELHNWSLCLGGGKQTPNRGWTTDQTHSIFLSVGHRGSSSASARPSSSPSSLSRRSSSDASRTPASVMPCLLRNAESLGETCRHHAVMDTDQRTNAARAQVELRPFGHLCFPTPFCFCLCRHEPDRASRSRGDLR